MKKCKAFAKTNRRTRSFRKGIIILIAVLTFGPVTFAQKLGHVNIQSVTDSLASMQEANKALESHRTEQTKIIEEMGKALEADYTKYLAEKDSLNSVIQKFREDKFFERQQEIQFKQQQLEQDLQTLYSRLFTPIQERLDKAVKIVAEKNGVVYVLEASQLIYVGEGLDLTKEVRAEMIKLEPSSGAGN
ncbi:OmpH family outer membrane protein [Crocinitomix catalasitica]|nr:OmpH family outer membrane protein [Crocinitomix catalasitica]